MATPLSANRSIGNMRDNGFRTAREGPMSSQPPRPDEVSAVDQEGASHAGKLERHAIGLPAVTAQSAALIAPAAGSVASLAFIAGYSGAATPLAFLIGLLVCVCVALVIGEYAKRL